MQSICSMNSLAGVRDSIAACPCSMHNLQVPQWIRRTSGGNGLPAISGWTASGDTHTAKISFMEDGSYGFKVKCADLADNAAKDYLGEIFVIDRSAPEIVFGGVRKNSANNGTAAPTLMPQPFSGSAASCHL